MTDIFDFDIKSSILESVTDVFDTMLGVDIAPTDEFDETFMHADRMVGSVNVAGEMVGIINIQMNTDFAVAMTAEMLGIEADEVEGEEEIKDLIAEMSNIVGGRLKSVFTDTGMSCVLSTPSITSGNKFTIESLNMERYEQFVFKYGTHFVLVQVGLKKGSADTEEEKASRRKNRLTQADFDKINSLNLKTLISDSVEDVFDTLLAMEVQGTESVSVDSLTGTRVVGTVNFAGDVMGIISIHVSEVFARIMAATMLDMDEDEIEGEDEINDLLGEISNIVGGNLKSTYSDAGLFCKLSTPSITKGEDFTIETLNLSRYERFAFQMEDHYIFVETGVKVPEFSQASISAEKDIHYSVDEISDADPQAGTELPAAAPSDDSDVKIPAPEVPPLPSALETAPPPEPPSGPPQPAAKVSSAKKESPAPVPEKEIEHLPQANINMDMLLDIPLEITVELGRTRKKINELLNYGQGTVVALSKLEGEPVDISVNETLIARGEVVVENEKYGIRITEIVSRMDRIKSLK